MDVRVMLGSQSFSERGAEAVVNKLQRRRPHECDGRHVDRVRVRVMVTVHM